MKKGDKLVCQKTINNLLGQPLFEKDKVYTVIYVDNESIKKTVCLDHILYANEYSDLDMEWVYENFNLIK